MSIIRDLKKTYADFKIDIPQWEIPDQGITALVGSSGSGKTSVLRLLLGLETPDSMSWKLGELEMGQLSAGERRLGVVFQNYLLFPHLTALENILFGAEARGMTSAQAQEKLKSWESRLGLAQFSSRPARLLSGGEQQRVALARALIGRPRFLFLDEPFSALDATLRQSSRELVKEMVQQENIPCLLVSHDPADIKALAHSEFSIENGRLKK